MNNNTRRLRGRNMLVMPRTRGGVAGLALVLLGLWGAIIPFVGPYFDYAYTPNTTWTWTAARFFLQVLPGAVTFFAGLVMLGSANRVNATVAGWLAAISGAWFVVGPLLAPIWNTNYIGTPVGDTVNVSVERIGIFFGLGAAIILFAAFALGRFSVIGARDNVRQREYEPYPESRADEARRVESPSDDRDDLADDGDVRVHSHRRARHD